MTPQPTVGDGAQALDIGTLYKLVQGTAVLSGLDVTINSGDFDAGDSLSVASGDVIVDGTEHSVSATTVGIDSATDNPRKDVVYVDSNGAVDVASGQEAEPLPVDEDTGQHAIREHAYSPSPPDLSWMAAVPIAEVWVDNETSSLEAADIRDRRSPGKIPTSVLEAIAVDDLDFDPTTQAEFGSHAGDADAHHAQDHASRHAADAADEVTVENLGTAGADGQVPTSQGDGTLAMEPITGAGSDLQWTEDPNSPMVLSGESSPTISLSSTYDEVLVRIHDLSWDGSGSSTFYMTANGGTSGGYDTELTGGMSESDTGNWTLVEEAWQSQGVYGEMKLTGTWSRYCHIHANIGATGSTLVSGDNDTISSPLTSLTLSLGGPSMQGTIEFYGRTVG